MENSLIEVRDIGEITEEILDAKRAGGEAVLTIGRCLIEAKEQLPHGEWLPWLSEQVEFSERSAQKYMRLYRECSNPQTLAVFGSEKAMELLSLPAPEREDFIAEAHVVNGVEKTVDEMSVRELKKAIRERDEALRQAEDERRARIKAEDELREAEDALEEAKGTSTAEEIKAAKAAGDAEKARLDAEQARAEQKAAEEAREMMGRQLQLVQARVEELEKRPVDVAVQAVSDPAEVEMALFKSALSTAMEWFNKANGYRLKMTGDRAEKAAGAMRKVAAQLGEGVGA